LKANAQTENVWPAQLEGKRHTIHTYSLGSVFAGLSGLLENKQSSVGSDEAEKEVELARA
jgi:hypothetical protein